MLGNKKMWYYRFLNIHVAKKRRFFVFVSLLGVGFELKNVMCLFCCAFFIREELIWKNVNFFLSC
jgi:hypothetical protein